MACRTHSGVLILNRVPPLDRLSGPQAAMPVLRWSRRRHRGPICRIIHCRARVVTNYDRSDRFLRYDDVARGIAQPGTPRVLTPANLQDPIQAQFVTHVYRLSTGAATSAW